MGDGDLEQIKISIAQMQVKIESVLDVMRAGDREAHAGTKLLAQTVEQIAKAQEQFQKDVKDTLGKFETGLNVQRKDIEADLTEHADHPGPHTLSLGARLDRLERRVNEARGAIALVFAVPAIYAIVQLLSNHSS